MNVTEIIEVKKHLGFILKEKQREVIAAVVKENDVFAVLPNGFGKTLSISTDKVIMQSTALSIFLRVLDSNF